MSNVKAEPRVAITVMGPDACLVLLGRNRSLSMTPLAKSCVVQ